MGIIGEEPVLSRLDRLDNMLRQLEEIRVSSNKNNNNKICNYNNKISSPRSSSASTPSSGTLTSTGTDGRDQSSVDCFSPTCKSLEKYCRPIEYVMMETQVKGSLIQRMDQVEDRLLKLCVQLEEELEEAKKREAVSLEEAKKREAVSLEKEKKREAVSLEKEKKKGHNNNKKGSIKQLVKQCVIGKQSQHKGMEWKGKLK